MLEDVVRRCQEGDKDSFRDLFRIHGDMIQRIAFRMTRNAELQREIFQQVAIRVIENIKAFRGTCKFSTWLYRITVNEALKVLEKERAGVREIEFEDSVNQTGNDGSPGPDALEHREMFIHAKKAIMQLPKNHQEIFSLFYFAEMSIEEIMQQTSKSKASIKSVLFKGRSRIVKNLRKQGLLDPL
jgi:RNA polymerase sigma factor, sigma-70 family